MDEQEDEAHHEPDDWEGVEDALEDSSQFSILNLPRLICHHLVILSAV
jgi:hypothetical protein